MRRPGRPERVLLVPSRDLWIPDEGAEWIERRLHEERRGKIGGLAPIGGGAKILPSEGLDYLLNATYRKTVTFPDPLYVGLFTSQTSSTVPAATAVLATSTGVTEASGGGYARAALAASLWAAPGAGTPAGRRTTVPAPGASFAESTGAYSAAVNGFFLASAAAAGVALAYSNSETVEGTPDAAVNVASAGYVVRVAPFSQLSSA